MAQGTGTTRRWNVAGESQANVHSRTGDRRINESANGIDSNSATITAPLLKKKEKRDRPDPTPPPGWGQGLAKKPNIVVPVFIDSSASTALSEESGPGVVDLPHGLAALPVSEELVVSWEDFMREVEDGCRTILVDVMAHRMVQQVLMSAALF
jgi:hypothetical protein